MSKKKSAFDKVVRTGSHASTVAQRFADLRQQVPAALIAIKNGKKICSISDLGLQAILFGEHFDELDENSQFEGLHSADANIREIVLVEFSAASLQAILLGKKFFDLYHANNLLAALFEADAKIQNSFIVFLTCANANHPGWSILKGHDLSRFLTHEFIQVRRVVAQVIDLRFITEEAIKVGLSDESDFVKTVWASRRDEFEHLKLSNKHLAQNEKAIYIPPAL